MPAESVAERAIKKAEQLAAGEPVEVGGIFGDQDWVRAAVLARELQSAQEQIKKQDKRLRAQRVELNDLQGKGQELQAAQDREAWAVTVLLEEGLLLPTEMPSEEWVRKYRAAQHTEEPSDG